MGLCFSILWMFLNKSLLRFYHLSLLSVLLLAVYLEQTIKLPIHLEVERRGAKWAEDNRGIKSAVLQQSRTFFACVFVHSSTGDSRLLCFTGYELRSDISDSSAARVQVLHSSTRWWL